MSCPSCKALLPVCALCVLPMHSINPGHQLQYELDEKRKRLAHSSKQLPHASSASSLRAVAAHSMSPVHSASKSSAPSRNTGTTFDGLTREAIMQEMCETASVRNSLPLAHWWCWCNTCHHGGHKQHMEEVSACVHLCSVRACTDGFAFSFAARAVVQDTRHLPCRGLQVRLHAARQPPNTTDMRYPNHHITLTSPALQKSSTLSSPGSEAAQAMPGVSAALGLPRTVLLSASLALSVCSSMWPLRGAAAAFASLGLDDIFAVLRLPSGIFQREGKIHSKQ